MVGVGTSTLLHIKKPGLVSGVACGILCSQVWDPRWLRGVRGRHHPSTWNSSRGCRLCAAQPVAEGSCKGPEAVAPSSSWEAGYPSLLLAGQPPDGEEEWCKSPVASSQAAAHGCCKSKQGEAFKQLLAWPKAGCSLHLLLACSMLRRCSQPFRWCNLVPLCASIFPIKRVGVDNVCQSWSWPLSCSKNHCELALPRFADPARKGYQLASCAQASMMQGKKQWGSMALLT